MSGRRGEDGSTLPLVVLFGMIGLALVLVAAAASSLYLERKRLFTVADGAALVGAEAFDLDEVAFTPEGPRPALDDEDVRRAVLDHLALGPETEFEGFEVDRATTLDGRSATVTVSAIWRPPVVTVFFPEGVRIEATAVARSVFD